MAGHRLPRAARLTQAAQFTRVFSQARRSADRFFVVLARPNDLDHPRLGLAVSKRSLPTAVGRNRVKRVVRDSFRREFLGRRISVDIVVMSRNIPDPRDPALRRSLAAHWERVSGPGGA